MVDVLLIRALMLVLLLFSLAALWHESKFLRLAIAAHSWVRKPCRVVLVEVRDLVNHDMHGKLLHVEYMFVVDGKEYRGDRAFWGSRSEILSDRQVKSLISRCGDPTLFCFVNPNDLSNSVLFTDLRLAITKKLLFSFFVLLVFLLMLVSLLLYSNVAFDTRRPSLTPIN